VLAVATAVFRSGTLTRMDATSRSTTDVATEGTGEVAGEEEEAGEATTHQANTTNAMADLLLAGCHHHRGLWASEWARPLLRRLASSSRGRTGRASMGNQLSRLVLHLPASTVSTLRIEALMEDPLPTTTVARTVGIGIGETTDSVGLPKIARLAFSADLC
jgi:hypothetical protein